MIRNDYILRVIQRLIEALSQIVSGKSVDKGVADEVLRGVMADDLLGSLPPEMIPQMLDVHCGANEDKKVLVLAALMLRDSGRYGGVCRGMLQGLDVTRLSESAKQLLEFVKKGDAL